MKWCVWCVCAVLDVEEQGFLCYFDLAAMGWEHNVSCAFLCLLFEPLADALFLVHQTKQSLRIVDVLAPNNGIAVSGCKGNRHAWSIMVAVRPACSCFHNSSQPSYYAA